MAFNYCVTAHPPTSVTHSCTGAFTGPHHHNLILAKSTRIELYLMTPLGLQPKLDIPFYANISVMELYRPRGEEQDVLFICCSSSADRYKFCVLAYDTATDRILTRSHSESVDIHTLTRFPRSRDEGILGMIDPQCRAIALHLFPGQLKVIPFSDDGRQLREAFHVRIEEITVVDIKFLYNCARPTLLVLHQDQRAQRHLRTYEIQIKEKDLKDGPWSQPNVESGAVYLIPIPAPLGGALIIGEQTITYHNGVYFTSMAIKPTIIKCHGRIDANGRRHLLGDETGALYVLLLATSGPSQVELKMEELGQTSIPSTISYLDNGLVFVGSAWGDSQLIHLLDSSAPQPMQLDHESTSTTVANQARFEVVESFPNLGPIVDFAVVDLQRQGQCQLVTCSGVGKDGSLRVIRNGIGIHHEAVIDMTGLKGVWAIRSSFGTALHFALVTAFVSETRVLGMQDNEMQEITIPGIQCQSSSLLCCNVTVVGHRAESSHAGYILQVTPTGLYLIDCVSLQLVNTWTVPSPHRITQATANDTQILVSVGGATLVYLEVHQHSFQEIHRVQLDHEVSCLSINPMGTPNQPQSERRAATWTDFCVVGLWDCTTRVMRLPTLEVLRCEPLGSDTIPRSVLLVTLEGVNYLLCGIGDGQLFSFVWKCEVDNGQISVLLTEKKRYTLGTQPLMLTPLTTHNTSLVFAASDRPAVIYSNSARLLFSNVNLSEVDYVCMFNHENYRDHLATATVNSLSLGTVDAIQRLHVRPIPLGEQPRRICHQESSHTLCLLTRKVSYLPNGEDVEEHFVRLLDDQTFEVLHSFPLAENETVFSIVSCCFSKDPQEYYVVGTAYERPGEDEPSSGRLLVFSVVPNIQRLRLEAEKEIKGGAPWCLSAFNGKLLAGVNSKVVLYRWTETDKGAKELNLEAFHHGCILALYISCRGDYIVVGDMMRSMTLLVYKPDDEKPLEEVARDFNTNWMVALEMIDDDHYVGADNFMNIFQLRKNREGITDEERSKLDVAGEFHLGDTVNRFRHGSLVMRLTDAERAIPTLLFGTIHGMVGVLAVLPEASFRFFSELEAQLRKVIQGVGGFSHVDWRAFSNDRRDSPARGFVDGDLIELTLELGPDSLLQIATALQVTPEELCRRVEEMARLH